jgi:hypothetical protein
LSVVTNTFSTLTDANNFHQFSDALSLNLSKGLKRFISLQTSDKAQLKILNQSIDALPANANDQPSNIGLLGKILIISSHHSFTPPLTSSLLP